MPARKRKYDPKRPVATDHPEVAVTAELLVNAAKSSAVDAQLFRHCDELVREVRSMATALANPTIYQSFLGAIDSWEKGFHAPRRILRERATRLREVAGTLNAVAIDFLAELSRTLPEYDQKHAFTADVAAVFLHRAGMSFPEIIDALPQLGLNKSQTDAAERRVHRAKRELRARQEADARSKG